MNTPQSLAELAKLGKRIEQEGFRFDYFHDSIVLFWQLMLDDTIDFAPENIEFIDPSVFLEELKDRGLRTMERIRFFLPPEAQDVSLLDMLLEYGKKIEPHVASGKVKPLFEFGCYNELRDICYIVNSIKPKGRWLKGMLEAKAASHQMAHRYCHKKRTEKGLQWGFPDTYYENAFAKELEACYARYVFPLKKQDPQKLEKNKEKLNKFLDDVFDPKKHLENIAQTLRYYTKVFAPQTLH